MNKFIVVNKPQGITSFGVIAKLRKKLNIRKMGHLGTLDPMATGVLVVAVNKATRLIEFLMGCDKTYEAEITLGAISDTYDAEGEITQNPFQKENLEEFLKKITKETLQIIINNKFTGEITQVPPKYSALKINGQKACDVMRKGGDIEMKSRKITIHKYTIENYNNGIIKATISCSTGTYIRSLAHDLGQELKCGACLTGLKRTQVGNFSINQAADIENIDQSNGIDLEKGIEHLHSYELNDDEYKKISHGIKIPTKIKTSGPIAMMYKKSVVCIGEYIEGEGVLKPKKVLI